MHARCASGDRPPRGTLAGVAVGFAGLALLVLPGDRPVARRSGACC